MNEKKEIIDVIDPDDSGDNIVYVERQTDIVTALDNISVEKAAEIIDKRVRIVEKLRQIAISQTNSKGDWMDLGGKPYATDSAIAKIARDCGISYRTMEIVKSYSSDERGKFYIYTAIVEVSHPWMGKIIKSGVATMRDKFFAYERGVWKADTEISEGNVKKKAETNAIGRGVRGLMGLNGLTWEEIGKTPGATVDYGKNKKKGAGQDKANTDSESGNDTKKEPLNKEKLNNMHTQIMEACNGDELVYTNLVKLVSGGFGNLTDVRLITTEKWRQRFVTDLQKKKLTEWVSMVESSLEKEPEGGDSPY